MRKKFNYAQILGPPVTTKPNQIGNKINCYLKIVRGKVALNGTNAKYSAFLSDQMDGCDSRKKQVYVSEWWIWSKNRILSKLLKSYSQIRVLKATAAKIPWTISPKLSLSRQFRSVEAMSVIGDEGPSSLEFDNEMGKEEEEDWFIGKALSSFLNHKGSWRQFRVNLSRIGHKIIKPLNDSSTFRCWNWNQLGYVASPMRYFPGGIEKRGMRITGVVLPFSDLFFSKKSKVSKNSF